jgi:hypothetical protein
MSMEIWLWGAAAIGSVVGLGYLGNQVMFGRMKRNWRQLANALGLTFDPMRWRIHGEFDGLRIEVLRVGDGSWEAQARIRGKAPLALTIRPRSFTEPFTTPVWDPDFDQHFIVEGSPVRVLALLSPGLRRAWLSEIVKRWTLDGDDEGWLLEADFSMELTSLLRPVVTEGLTLGRKVADAGRCFLAHPSSTAFARALVERLSDPSPRIRALVAQSLATYQRSEPEVAPALTLALNDPEPSVRLEAALVLDRADVMVALARAADSGTAIRRAAFSRAVELAPRDTATLAMVRAWALGDATEPRLEALAVLPKVTDELEPLLLEVLTVVERNPDDASLAVLFRMLETHGTASSVPRLLPYRDRFFDSRLKGLARDAILAIQSRAGGSTGALSLTLQGGELSEPE